MAQTKQGIHNSMLLECVSWDREHITLRNVEGEGEFVCTHAFCRVNLRSALCFTMLRTRQNYRGYHWPLRFVAPQVQYTTSLYLR